MSLKPPTIFDNYDHLLEIVPGVFIDNANKEVTAVYIVDRDGEIVCWNTDEFADDATGFTAALTAVALAAKHGARMVRLNLQNDGEIIIDLCEETARTVNRMMPLPDHEAGYTKSLVNEILVDHEMIPDNFWHWMRGQTTSQDNGVTIVCPHDLLNYMNNGGLHAHITD